MLWLSLQEPVRHEIQDRKSHWCKRLKALQMPKHCKVRWKPWSPEFMHRILQLWKIITEANVCLQSQRLESKHWNYFHNKT